MNDIEQFQQNHPELVVRDLQKQANVSPEITREILKFRGVNKWLRVRKLLIQLKNKWKSEITYTQQQLQTLKRRNLKEYYKQLGYMRALADCRQQVRALCHSPRDVDFPTTHTDEFGSICKLPADFPKRPHKNYLRKKK